MRDGIQRSIQSIHPRKERSAHRTMLLIADRAITALLELAGPGKLSTSFPKAQTTFRYCTSLQAPFATRLPNGPFHKSRAVPLGGNRCSAVCFVKTTVVACCPPSAGR